MPKHRYADDSKVPVERSEAEVKTVLRRYGCYDITTGEYQGQSFIVAHYVKRRIRITVNMPALTEFQFNTAGNKRSQTQAQQGWSKEVRRQWRVLVLLLKAKFEAVHARPEIFDYEFLAYLVDPATGRTIGEQIVPQIANAYEGHTNTPLMLGPGQ